MPTTPAADDRQDTSDERDALWSLIQDHLDRTAVTERAFAPLAGIKHQTLNAWKHRELRQLPHRQSLDQIARALGVPYFDVLAAALYDAGFVDDHAALAGNDPTTVLEADRRRVVLDLVELLRVPETSTTGA